MKELSNSKEQKITLPKKRATKKSAGKNIRIDDRYYEIIRRKAFEEDTTMKDIIDNILSQNL